MSTTTLDAAAGEGGVAAARRGPRTVLYRSWRGFVTTSKVSHRWIALVFGLLLLIETTSGSILLFRPYIDNWTGHTASGFVATPSAHPISLGEAAAIVEKAHPKFGINEVDFTTEGTDVVDGAPSDLVYVVDPGSGRIIGSYNPTPPWIIQFLLNVHEEGWSDCTSGPGCITFLNHPFPGAGTVGLEGVDWGQFYLGVLALMLLYLCASGLVLWWPGVKRFARSLSVRMKAGTYRRDRDLHRVIGFVVLPFLLLWALTGAQFTLPFVTNVAYAVQSVVGFPSASPNYPGVTSKPAKGPDVTYAEAAQAALRVTHGGTIAFHRLPDPTDPTSTYNFSIIEGRDDEIHNPNGNGLQGNVFVQVDQHDARRAAIDISDRVAESPADWLFNGWGTAGIHAARWITLWQRIVLFIAGMAPLLLAVTGISTWLYRKKRRNTGRRTGAPLPPLDGELDDPEDDTLLAPE